MSDGMIVSLCFLGMGFIMALIDVICIMFHKKKRKRCSVETEATIVEDVCYREGLTGSREYYHYAIYEYQYNGITYKNRSKMGTSMPAKVGKRRTLYLNPENPEDYLEKRFLSYLHITIVTIMASIMSLIGMICVVCEIFG